jgi:hypothetical protein
MTKMIIDDKRGALPDLVKVTIYRMDYDVASQNWYLEYRSSSPGYNIYKNQTLYMPIEDFNKGKEPKEVSNDVEAWFKVVEE